jgi:glycine/D-amino acid oxidase-like deaminating enzyme
VPVLLVVGGGLFGSQAAALARRNGIEAMVFDPGRAGASSPAAAGLFTEAWAGKKLAPHYHRALPVLDRLYGLRRVRLVNDAGARQEFLFVPPTTILEPTPVRETVTAIGDGWLEAGGRRYHGWVYVAAGIWCEEFCPGLGVRSKAGAAFLFPGERPGIIRSLGPGRQALLFPRDPGRTYFSDGTAEQAYTETHDRQTLTHARALGLTGEPIERLWGYRPYTPGGPLFLKLGSRCWLATGGRKMGTILGASLARRLVEEELR